MSSKRAKKKTSKPSTKYLTIKEAINFIGSRQFYGEWEDGNADAVFLPVPPADVKQLIKDYQPWIKAKLGLNVNDIEHGIEILDHHTDEVSAAERAAHKLLPILRALPEGRRIEDSSYEEWYKAGKMRKEVEEKLYRALCDEKISAFYDKEDGTRERVPAGFWRKNKVQHNNGVSFVEIAGEIQAFFDGLSLSKYIRNFSAKGATLEKECMEWLIEKMRTESKTKPRLKYLEDFNFNRSPHLSGRAYERAWRGACQKTKSGWDKRGPPHKK